MVARCGVPNPDWGTKAQYGCCGSSSHGIVDGGFYGACWVVRRDHVVVDLRKPGGHERESDRPDRCYRDRRIDHVAAAFFHEGNERRSLPDSLRSQRVCIGIDSYGKPSGIAIACSAVLVGGWIWYLGSGSVAWSHWKVRCRVFVALGTDTRGRVSSGACKPF